MKTIKKILASTCIVFGIFYVFLCTYVHFRMTIFPNITIADTDLSGLTLAEAERKLKNSPEKQILVFLKHDVWMDSFVCEVEIDNKASAIQAMKIGRETFWKQGICYLQNLLGKKTEIMPILSMTERTQIELNRLLDQAEQTFGCSVTNPTWEIDGTYLKITKGSTGVAVLREDLYQKILSAISVAYCDDTLGFVTIPLPTFQIPAVELNLDDIYKEIFVEAKSAELNTKTFEVSNHIVGIDFDIEDAATRCSMAGEGEIVLVPLSITLPQVLKEDIEEILFSDLLGEATSVIKGTPNRRQNVKLSAEACNNTILLPGEEFSYNSATGSRSPDKGYLPAPVYFAGKSVDEIGGGICQTSSTIYCALLHTTLEIIERHNHRYAVEYVPDGMDATVYYGSLDFRFRNNTDYPVKIVTQCFDKKGIFYLNVKILGLNTSGYYAVPQCKKYDWIFPTTEYIADDSIPRGTTKVDTKQNPYTGRSVSVHRLIYSENETLVETQNLGVSKYSMRPTIVYYNPLDGSPNFWNDTEASNLTNENEKNNQMSLTETEKENQISTLITSISDENNSLRLS